MRQSLTDAKIRKAKPRERPYKLADGGRLFVLVNPNGSRLWRWRYEVAGKERLLALGSYPEISLQEARRLRDEARTLVKRGIDPVAHRRAEKARAEHSAATTFRLVAAEYVESARAKGRAPKTILKMEQLVRRAATLANRPIAAITSAEILTLLKDSVSLSKRHATRWKGLVIKACIHFTVSEPPSLQWRMSAGFGAKMPSRDSFLTLAAMLCATHICVTRFGMSGFA